MTFEEYVLARGPGLLRLARLLVDDVHRADDLVQDTLVRVYPRWARILRTDQPDLYVRRTLINVNASWWRRRSSREMPAEIDGDAFPGAHDHGPPTAERLALWSRVRALPKRQRAVIALRYYEDLDDERIAQILGCSRATVRTHAMRALAAMRVELHDLKELHR
ncbi:SigE family RNA polymerase sigma factor [Dactylosporangium sp. AC04546]|uniref:SigE family RNA polymerase sigma factor n=1 Tax=Dactylosporangium sp. AC04546 TaxID=2862460 RepID=UPI001EDCBE91|nr:SigE family RNA polymerase sigma factor [Dactylosporangium sp. AC04546]WVK83529.1 SigE family RNA polymerase sigma factor [Dactylosporangium sp. AC04546]